MKVFAAFRSSPDYSATTNWMASVASNALTNAGKDE